VKSYIEEFTCLEFDINNYFIALNLKLAFDDKIFDG
jgi:hypothetical protein